MLSSGDRRKAMISAMISITTQRMVMRMTIWKVICSCATSEVKRVTMEEEENLSMLLKLKFCTR